MGRRTSWLLSAACAWACAGCISYGYQRQLIECAPDLRELGALPVGETGLSDVLQRFGAPLDVWEGAAGGPVVSYGGLRSSGWGASVSVPLTDYGSASYSYSDARAKTRGVILIFDPELRLTLVRAGLLRDLRQQSERRPAAPGEDDA